jgi:hypothetical protein
MLDPSHVVTTAAEPACCSSCGLRHTRRPDWLCPRCGAPVGGDEATPIRRPPPPRELGFPLGSRIAGTILAVASGALAAALAKDPAGPHRWSLLAALLALAVLGVALLLGLGWARWVVAVSAVAAVVLAAEHLVRERLPGLLRDPLPATLRDPLRALLRELQPTSLLLVLGFASGCLLLVAGRARRVRIAAGVLLAVPLVASVLVHALAR